MPYSLKIIVAPETSMVGTKYALVEGPNYVGRIAPPCAVVLEGKKVSKRHCSFVQEGDSLRVEDLGSSNGIFVNGKKVTNAVLKLRDRLVVGEYTLEIGTG